MRRPSFKVVDDDVRPARPDGTCFYCRVPLGGEHEEGCVIRERTVVYEIRFLMVDTVPEDWTEEQINFFKNGNTSCVSNQLEKASHGCPCGGLRYVREATEDDEEREVWAHERDGSRE